MHKKNIKICRVFILFPIICFILMQIINSIVIEKGILKLLKIDFNLGFQ